MKQYLAIKIYSIEELNTIIEICHKVKKQEIFSIAQIYFYQGMLKKGKSIFINLQFLNFMVSSMPACAAIWQNKHCIDVTHLERI
jgi:hypothetical protein